MKTATNNVTLANDDHFYFEMKCFTCDDDDDDDDVNVPQATIRINSACQLHLYNKFNEMCLIQVSELRSSVFVFDPEWLESIQSIVGLSNVSNCIAFHF
ncbi:hypothetical protein DERF_006315 [Dermatophagoides farinae]|uniref:Uncharacterized protein n=1 Tax=Dermatophagoides farinae TaxID=6954 RepID=A0A922I5X4_DERFA|nr:hypothetical protein DERF_006315 [Dermatophagoides farinae]